MERVLERIQRRFCLRGTRADQALLLQNSLRLPGSVTIIECPLDVSPPLRCACQTASDGDTLRHGSDISELGTTDEVRDYGSTGDAVYQAAPDSEEALREQPYKATV